MHFFGKEDLEPSYLMTYSFGLTLNIKGETPAAQERRNPR